MPKVIIGKLTPAFLLKRGGVFVCKMKTKLILLVQKDFADKQNTNQK